MFSLCFPTFFPRCRPVLSAPPVVSEAWLRGHGAPGHGRAQLLAGPAVQGAARGVQVLLVAWGSGAKVILSLVYR